MTTLARPEIRPANPCFSSGPCAKRPGWTLEGLKDAFLGRSHRAKGGKAKLAEVIARSRAMLGMPEDWRLGIVPASDTGAIEMAMWSLLGERGVDMLAWESFGTQWITDVRKQLRLPDVRALTADYGRLPVLTAVDPRRDVIFTWNGTTSGVAVPDADWLSEQREGLVLCDATSAVFAYEMPWPKLDVVTWSCQKVLGGVAQHGMLAIGPRAAARLQRYTPAWPMPKLFRLIKGGAITEGLFAGETINTPSMLAVEDALDGLRWAESIGGLPALIARSESNFAAIARWVDATPWVDFLAEEKASRSRTSVCLKIVDPRFAALPPEGRAAAAKQLATRVDQEGAGYDIASYRDAPAGLRLWAGATVETADLAALFPWLDWAWQGIAAELAAA